MKDRIPHLNVVVAVTFFVLIGFTAVTGYVLAYSSDDVTKGALIGVWMSSATGAVGFWLGSSSGGKASQHPPIPPDASGAAQFVADEGQAAADIVKDGQ